MDNNFRRSFFVFASLTLSLVLTILAPIIPAIHENMMVWLVGVGAVITVMALFKKNRFDAIFAGIITAAFLASWRLFPAEEQRVLAIRTCSTIAFTLLNLVLLIGPWARFTKTIERLYKHRRHMGVTVFLLGLMHFALLFGPYFSYSFHLAFMSFFTFFGFTALLVLIFLALTSLDWCQKYLTLKHWKIIHALGLLIYLPTVAYAFWVNLGQNLPIEPLYFGIIATFILFWVIVAPWGLAPKLVRFGVGWKQLHVLIYVAYVSLIIHAWEASSYMMPDWVKILFWGMIAFVFLSHFIGWIKKWREEKMLKEAEKNAEVITHEGYEYISAGRVEDFRENVGKKILVEGFPVAVYKFKEAFYAWFAVCPHQKGPLERGKIIKGYLTCPWHQWQFSTKDGCGPPGYKDCVPFHPTLVKDNQVYVRKNPQPQANGHEQKN